MRGVANQPIANKTSIPMQVKPEILATALKSCKKLCYLNLTSVDLFAHGAKVVFPTLSGLELQELGLFNSAIGGEGIAALIAQVQLARLRVLDVGTCRIDDDTAKVLADALGKGK